MGSEGGEVSALGQLSAPLSSLGFVSDTIYLAVNALGRSHSPLSLSLSSPPASLCLCDASGPSSNLSRPSLLLEEFIVALQSVTKKTEFILSEICC